MVIIDVLYLPAYPVGLCAKCQVIVPLIGGNGRKIGCSKPITLIKQTKKKKKKSSGVPAPFTPHSRDGQTRTAVVYFASACPLQVAHADRPGLSISLLPGPARPHDSVFPDALPDGQVSLTRPYGISYCLLRPCFLSGRRIPLIVCGLHACPRHLESMSVTNLAGLTGGMG